MENDAQTSEYGQWYSRLKMYISVFFFFFSFFFVKPFLVHIWAGLGLGWFWSTDQLKEVWTWIKTLFVPDVITKCSLSIEGLVYMYSNLLAGKQEVRFMTL